MHLQLLGSSKMGKKITETRLREVAVVAGGKVVKAMADRLEVTLPDDALKCEYVGTEEEDAPLHSRTRILFEWRLRGGGIVKTNTTPMQVLHQGTNGLVPPIAFKKLFLFACLPTYLEAKKNLPFLARVASVRCHHVAAARPMLKYKTTDLEVNGSGPRASVKSLSN